MRATSNSGLDGREHPGGRRRRLELKSLGLEQQAERFEHIGLVVGNQDARLGWTDRMPGVLFRRLSAAFEVIGDQHG